MREPASGGDFLFFAADPDFQVAVQDDPRAYPRTTAAGGYRQTVVACSTGRTRYAVSVFEVKGGSKHDQFFHGPPATDGRWLTSVPTTPRAGLAPRRGDPVPRHRPGRRRPLVRPGLRRVRPAQARHGRRPSFAEWHEAGRSPLRLHLLDDAPYEVVTATSPRDPGARRAEPVVAPRSAARATGDEPLESTFVTVVDPTLGDSTAGNLVRVGRMNDTPGFVVLFLETPDGPEHLAINLQPGTIRKTQLADGRDLATDGRVGPRPTRRVDAGRAGPSRRWAAWSSASRA